jgi:hypothetical protein
MKGRKTSPPHSVDTTPIDVLRQFVEAFAEKGWLKRNIRIRRCNRNYWISCSKTEFFAYRISDNCGISPGIPGWPVCIVKKNKIINDSEMSAFASTEPSAGDWLRCIADNDFEMI